MTSSLSLGLTHLGVARIELRIEFRIIHLIPDDPMILFVLSGHEREMERKGLRLEHRLQTLTDPDTSGLEELVQIRCQGSTETIQIVMPETIETDQEDCRSQIRGRRRWDRNWSTVLASSPAVRGDGEQDESQDHEQTQEGEQEKIPPTTEEGGGGGGSGAWELSIWTEVIDGRITVGCVVDSSAAGGSVGGGMDGIGSETTGFQECSFRLGGARRGEHPLNECVGLGW